MIVDGKKIAEHVSARTRDIVSKLGSTPRLVVIVCAPNFETQKYLDLKEKKAIALGISVTIITLNEASTTEDFKKTIVEHVAHSDGLIVQLPLPTHIDTNAVLSEIPITHDVDVLSKETQWLLSPVVGSIKEILEEHHITVKEKFVTILGSGRLVGLPAYRWFVDQGAHVSVVTKDTIEIAHYTQHADIIVCGAGKPNLLTPDMISDGVVILDAGTSEDGGELRGDADPLCAEKALLFTPVPGGIGPITVAILLSNVVASAQRKSSMV